MDELSALSGYNGFVNVDLAQLFLRSIADVTSKRIPDEESFDEERRSQHAVQIVGGQVVVHPDLSSPGKVQLLSKLLYDLFLGSLTAEQHKGLAFESIISRSQHHRHSRLVVSCRENRDLKLSKVLNLHGKDNLFCTTRLNRLASRCIQPNSGFITGVNLGVVVLLANLRNVGNELGDLRSIVNWRLLANSRASAHAKVMSSQEFIEPTNARLKK